MTERRVRRVVVALNAARDSLDAVEAAARLAARLEAELHGLFLEDEDLFHLAGQPSASVFSTVSGGRQPFDLSALERALRVRTTGARRLLEEAAGRLQVKASFEVLRGRGATALVGSTEEGDLLIVQWSATRGGVPTPPDRAARDLARGRERSVFLLTDKGVGRGPVMVPFDGSESAERALAIAADVAEEHETGAGGSEVVAILVADSPEEGKRLEQRVRQLLGGRRLLLRTRALRAASVARLCQVAAERGAGFLVLGTELPFLADADAEQVLRDARCSVLMVR
jgi:nucleotide-binding universal stress UspA family protein